MSDDARYEYCCVCGEETGNGGIGDGSVYCAECEVGPLCRHCSVFEQDAWCVDCAGREIERLRAELAKVRNASHEAGLNNLIELAAKDRAYASLLKLEDLHAGDTDRLNKRIEELYELTAAPLAAVLLYEQVQAGEVHVITDAQIDLAWADAWRKYRATDSTAGFSALEKAGIVACPKCGGSGLWPPPQPAQDEPCPGCQVHGWVKKPPGVTHRVIGDREPAESRKGKVHRLEGHATIKAVKLTGGGDD